MIADQKTQIRSAFIREDPRFLVLCALCVPVVNQPSQRQTAIGQRLRVGVAAPAGTNAGLSAGKFVLK